ncbi:MAG: ETX/MTX2 family pore-forming toxin [Solitalea-like symbiont of Tyrophagus putrescentiae]
MKYYTFKLFKLCTTLLLIISFLTLYYGCSRQDILSLDEQSANENCLVIDSLKDEATKSVVKILDDLVVDISNAYIKDINSLEPKDNNLYLVSRKYCNVDMGHIAMTLIDHPNINDLKPTYHTIQTFANNTGQTQIYSSLEHAEIITNTTSSTVSKSFGIGIQLGADVDIPFVGEGINFELNFSFNLTSTNTKVNTKTDTDTLKSMSVSVPAHKKYELAAVLYRQKMDAEVFLEIPVNFTNILFAKNASHNNADVYFNQHEIMSGIKAYKPGYYDEYPYFTTNKKGQFVYRNKATINADYGLNLETQLNDITDPKNPILIKRFGAKVLPIKK